ATALASRGLHVALAVAVHPARGEVRAELVARTQQQARRRLPARAAVTRCVRTHEGGGERHAAGREIRLEPRLEAREVLEREATAPDPALVRRDREREAGIGERARAGHGARQQLVVGEPVRIAAVAHQRAVAIEEDERPHAAPEAGRAARARAASRATSRANGDATLIGGAGYHAACAGRGGSRRRGARRSARRDTPR